MNARGLPEASAARVLIRPEGVHVDIDEHGPARVARARLLGRCSHLRLDADGLDAPLQALVPGVFLPPAQTPVRITIDPSQTFVFPAA